MSTFPPLDAPSSASSAPPASPAEPGMTAPPGPPAPPGETARRRAGEGRRPLPLLAASVLSAVIASGITAAIVDDPGATAPVPPAGPVAAGTDTAEPVAVAAATIAPAVVQITTGTGVGSGVIYDAGGLVLTVAHVVGNQRTVEVRLSDGSTVAGTVLGADADTDVAVVRILSDTVPAVAELAAGELPLVGQMAVAVGSPFGFEQTVTSGIVSAVDRVVNDVAMVQTDAAINPGNSGGPLVDFDGRVLGLSDVIFTRSGGSEGVGFAIQIDLARLVADQIVAGDPVQLALLGVSTASAADGARGAQVAEVSPGSAADAAGIEVGDLLISIDGEAIADGGRLRAQIIRRAPGSDVTIGVERGSETLTLAATLGSSRD